MNKVLFAAILGLLSLRSVCPAQAATTHPTKKVTIVGGGIAGTLEAYYAYLDAKKEGVQVCITVYDKNRPFAQRHLPTNTGFNIVPSLTVDEILSVVPRGHEMSKKLAILFSQPGGIRIDDVPSLNESDAAIRFKEAVALYGADKNHDDRTEALLNLGKMSMQLWQDLYDNADDELKAIFKASNYNPSREVSNSQARKLHDGYRVDLIHGVPNARTHAQGMKETYSSLGYSSCAILTPQEVVAIDPFLLDFAAAHSRVNDAGEHQWNDDSVALWRPGGCIDTSVFLPKLYEYLRKHAGTYVNKEGKVKSCFRMKFDKEVTSATFDNQSNKLTINGLGFKDGSQKREGFAYTSSQYLFCPGEAIGTLRSFGLTEPEYAGFAGPVLKLDIPVMPDELAKYQDFNHCMEVHKEGIVLAWQARVKENSIFIGVAGTKAFYGDRIPQIGEDFARNRHLTQLNMINEVLPEFVSLAFRRDTKGQELTWTDLLLLEKRGMLDRWVGRRAVTYDGFPTLGALYHQGQKVANARCTTHLGSGGVSFAPGVVHASRLCDHENNSPLIAKVLHYADSRRAPSAAESK